MLRQAGIILQEPDQRARDDEEPHATTRYIQQQEQHHKKRSFRDELVVMLRKHKIEFEEWMLDDDAKIGA